MKRFAILLAILAGAACKSDRTQDEPSTTTVPSADDPALTSTTPGTTTATPEKTTTMPETTAPGPSGSQEAAAQGQQLATVDLAASGGDISGTIDLKEAGGGTAISASLRGMPADAKNLSLELVSDCNAASGEKIGDLAVGADGTAMFTSTIQRSSIVGRSIAVRQQGQDKPLACGQVMSSTAAGGTTDTTPVAPTDDTKPTDTTEPRPRAY